MGDYPPPTFSIYYPPPKNNNKSGNFVLLDRLYYPTTVCVIFIDTIIKKHIKRGEEKNEY